jgi:hypothetical protein
VLRFPTVSIEVLILVVTHLASFRRVLSNYSGMVEFLLLCLSYNTLGQNVIVNILLIFLILWTEQLL